MSTDKEFLIRVRADIKEALDQMKKLGDGVGKAGDESAGAGQKFKTLQNRLDPVAAAAKKFKQEAALLDKQLKKGNISVKKHADLTRRLRKEQKATAQSAGVMSKSIRNMTVAALAYVSLRSAIGILKDADAYAVLQQRIKTATKETQDHVGVAHDLYLVSRLNGVAFRDTVSLFQNLARTAPELKATNAEMIELTNLVQQLGVIGGSTKGQLSSGLLQFSQGLAGGVFRAEEFNSIIENIPELASRIAKGLGKSTGQLRKAVIEGKVLSTDVFEALKKQAAEINAEFEGIPVAMERAEVSLGASFTRLLGQVDKLSGATSFFAKLYGSAAQGFDNISDKLDTDNLEAQLNVLEKMNHEVDKLLEEQDGSILGADYGLELTLLLREINKVSDNISRLTKETAGLADGKKNELIEVNKQQGSVDKLIDKLRTQRETMRYTNEELVIYQLNLAHASDAEIELALRISDETNARKKQLTLMEEGKKVIEDNKTEYDILAETLVRLDYLYEKGALGVTGSAEAMDNYSNAIFRAIGNLEEFEEAGKEAFDELLAATKGWGKEFANTLADMVVDGKGSFKDLADSIIKEILRILIYQNLIKPVLAGFSTDSTSTSTSVSSSSFQGAVGHTGGIVGSLATSRNVSSQTWNNAPRLHRGGLAGLSSNEVPAILEREEEVLTRDNPRHILNQGQGGSGGSVKVELINKGNPSKATQAGTRFDGKDFVVSIVLDDLERNGPLSSAIDSKISKGRGL